MMASSQTHHTVVGSYGTAHTPAPANEVRAESFAGTDAAVHVVAATGLWGHANESDDDDSTLGMTASLLVTELGCLGVARPDFLPVGGAVGVLKALAVRVGRGDRTEAMP